MKYCQCSYNCGAHERARFNPDINWNKAGRHWRSLQTTLHALRAVSQLGLLDTQQGVPVTRGEEGLPRHKVFDQGEFDLGHDYLPEGEANIKMLDDMLSLVQSLGGTGEGMSEDDIDLSSGNIETMSKFLDKTQSNWREYLGSIDGNCESESGLFFECLSSYIDASIGMLGRSKRKQVRMWARSLATDRDALVEVLQLSPDRDPAGFDWYQSHWRANKCIFRKWDGHRSRW